MMFTDKLLPTIKDDFWTTMFSDFDNLMSSNRFDFSQAFPAMNVYVDQNDNGFHLEMALCGYAREYLTVEIDGQELTISAKVPENKEEEEQRHYFKQRVQAKDFKRVYKIPSELDIDKAEVSFENGLLQISIPPKEVKSNVKKIEIK